MDETKERLEQLRAHESLGISEAIDILLDYRIGETYNERSGRFRECVIDLLERSDPDGWTDEQLVDAGLVRLPRDGDGEYIHVGDTVYGVEGRELSVLKVILGDYPYVLYEIHAVDNDGKEHKYASRHLTHRPPVTVESVLYDLIGEIKALKDDGSWRVPYDELNIVKEAAKRLRLAEVDE